MFKKHKGKIILGAVIVVLLVLIALPQIKSSEDDSKTSQGQWNDAGVNCLPPNAPLAFHNHADLTVKIDGETQQIPKGLGMSNSCVAEIHTHDPDNVVHAESANPDKQLTLDQFFAVWGKKIDKPGYTLATSTVDGQPVEQPSAIILRDGIDITLSYVSNSTSTQPTSTSTQ